MIDKFEVYLKSANLAQNSVRSYLFAVKQFYSKYKRMTQETLKSHKTWLIENYRVKTVNLRIRGLNCYLDFIGRKDWRLSFIREQQKAFLENVISEADYIYFRNRLRGDGEYFWYFVVRFLAATGARISELLQMKVEHVKAGYMDLYSKGGKLRRVYIPKALQSDAIDWLNDCGRYSGFVFLNRRGNLITGRGISCQLKKFAERYGIDKAVVYPHSFRHRFAKSFLERHNDIAFLADLMGHESIETTRIYLRKTAVEQRSIVDEIVEW